MRAWINYNLCIPCQDIQKQLQRSARGSPSITICVDWFIVGKGIGLSLLLRVFGSFLSPLLGLPLRLLILFHDQPLSQDLNASELLHHVSCPCDDWVVALLLAPPVLTFTAPFLFSFLLFMRLGQSLDDHQVQ